MPSILELLEIKIPETIQGKSFINLIKNKTKNHKEYAFSEAYPVYIKAKCIRSNEWKLILNEEKENELYNLKEDPKEERNLIKENIEKARELKEKIKNWLKGEISFEEQKPDEFTVERLKALGYID